MNELDYLIHQANRMVRANPDVTIGEYWEKMTGKVWRKQPQKLHRVWRLNKKMSEEPVRELLQPGP